MNRMYRRIASTLILALQVPFFSGACSSPGADGNLDSYRWQQSRAAEETLVLGTSFQSLKHDSVTGAVQWQTSGASLDRAFGVKIQNMLWVVAVRGVSERIVFVSTTDSQFITKELITVGSPFSKAVEVTDGERSCGTWLCVLGGTTFWLVRSYEYRLGGREFKAGRDRRFSLRT